MPASQEIEDLKTQPFDSLIFLHPWDDVRKDQSKKKKEIALQATTEMEKEIEDEDMVLIIRKFKRFLNGKSNRKKRRIKQ